jgi:hypothetical protein
VPLRPTLLGRLVLGALSLALGLAVWSDPSVLAAFLRQQTAWQALPIVGGLRPIELSLVVALGRFTAGVFLLGGFITRGMALLSVLIAALLVWLPAPGLLLNGAALVLACSVVLFGGGGHTLDGVLGRMQRRSLEKERQRQAAREAARRQAPG